MEGRKRSCWGALHCYQENPMRIWALAELDWNCVGKGSEGDAFSDIHENKASVV